MKRGITFWVGLDVCNDRRVLIAHFGEGTPKHNIAGRDFQAVLGPFKTKAGAEYVQGHGFNNPKIKTPADADRIGRLSTVRRSSPKAPLSNARRTHIRRALLKNVITRGSRAQFKPRRFVKNPISKVRLPLENEKAVHGWDAGAYIYRRAGRYYENNIYGGADRLIRSKDALVMLNAWSEASISAGRKLRYTPWV